MTARLLRILGPGFGLAMILGATVGGEVLRLPGSVALALGGLTLPGFESAIVFLSPFLLLNYLLCFLSLPVEEVEVVPMESADSVKYWRDDAGVHHVPKRSQEEVLLPPPGGS